MTTEGIQADENKVKAIMEMPPPTDIHRLGQISNNVPRKSPVGIFEEKGATHFF